MGDTKTEKTVAEELKQAVKTLRCDHAFPCNPPGGTIWAPGPCLHCGLPCPDDDEEVPDALREPLAASLEIVARVAKAHPQDSAYAGLSDFCYCLECQDEEPECAQIVAGALAVARVLNGSAS